MFLFYILHVSDRRICFFPQRCILLVSKTSICEAGICEFLFSPDEFLFKSVVITVDFKRIRRVEREYTNMHPPINVLVMALRT